MTVHAKDRKAAEVVAIPKVEAKQIHSAIVPAQSAMSMTADEFGDQLGSESAKRKLLETYIREHLVDGVDYGKLHIVGKAKCMLGPRCTIADHWSKASLFKPGAEKITALLHLRAKFLPDTDVLDMLSDEVHGNLIAFRCELSSLSGEIMAEGRGSRDVRMDGDVNKSVKMSQKSAHVDAVLRIAALSGTFTQDLEDTPAASRPITMEAGIGEKGQEQEPGAMTEVVASELSLRELVWSMWTSEIKLKYVTPKEIADVQKWLGDPIGPEWEGVSDKKLMQLKAKIEKRREDRIGKGGDK